MPSRDPEPLAARRMLRRAATGSEQRMWRLLRDRRIKLKFRRQHTVGPYVLDFYCPEHRLAIEVDGGQHSRPLERARDQRRTAWLRTQGIRVIRFDNLDVLGDVDGVIRAIWAALGKAG